MHFIPKIFVILGALLAFSGVALGAFGAHFLKSRLSQDALNIFEVGVRYQMYHALAIVLLACLYIQFPQIGFVWAASFFVLGILLFSGSLYALAYLGIKALGMITPIGGLAFLIGWILLVLGVL